MTIGKGDILLFEDTGSIATVIDGDTTTGWLALIEAHGQAIRVSDASATRDQATFIDAPAGRPPVGSTVVAYSATSTTRWHLDGYATTPVFGSGFPFAVLTSIDDPAKSAYVDASQIFPA